MTQRYLAAVTPTVIRLLASLVTAAFVCSPIGAAPAQQRPRTVAMTFDDLPFAGALPANPAADQRMALKANKAIQRALRVHSAPAIGFVNESKLRELGTAGLTILKSWNQGSFMLGNHGFAHADSNSLTLTQIEQEIDRGELTIRPLVNRAGRTLRYFRFPYNHVGDTEEKRVAIERLLALRGYRLAASTIDTSDYLFARAYDRAIVQSDAAMQEKIKEAYLDYTKQQVSYYADLNSTVLGYEPPEVMLLHLNNLNAAVMERILKMLEDFNYRFVTLDQAQSDPAYERTPAVATKFGPMWGYRWARERGLRVDGSREKEPPQWVLSYGEGK